MLCNLAYKYTREKGTSEDIVQDTFVRFFELKKNNFSEQESVAYLVQAVRNNCISSLRKGRSVHIQMDDKIAETTTMSGNDDHEFEKSEKPDSKEIVERALATLPPKCCIIFKMSRLENMSYKDISKALGISEKTVENQMSKAIRIIREFARSNRIWIVSILLLW